MEFLAGMLSLNPAFAAMATTFRDMASLIQAGRASLTVTPHADGVSCLFVVDKSVGYETIAPSVLTGLTDLLAKFQLGDVTTSYPNTPRLHRG
jgi:hypothetical protein